MTQKTTFFAVVVASSMLLGSPLAAQEQSGADRSGKATRQPPASPAPQPPPVQEPRTPPLNTLQTDPRWPQLKNCIDNTGTPDAFQACLQKVLGGGAAQSSAPAQR
jgi:hypothetical protein